MKKAIIFLTIFILILTTAAPIASARDYQSEIPLRCGVDYLLCLDDGSEIISKNAAKKLAPASMTKITTALVVLQNCKDLSETVTVQESTLEAIKNTNSSVAGLKAGESMSVLQMLYCLLVPSGNDAALVLAEHVAGNQEKFVQMMNVCAKRLGCKNTHYDNVHGLDSETHYSTAKDIAVIAQAAMKYNEFRKIVSTDKYTLPAKGEQKERVLTNTNFMLNKAYRTYYRDYIKGIKTGHTDNSGYCVVTYASKNGYNYLAVTMKGKYEDTDNDKIEENQAFMDTIHMFDWAFSNLSYELIASSSMMVAEVDVNYSWKTDHMRLVPEKDTRALVPTGTNEGSVLIVPVDKPEQVDAPIKAGEIACKAKVLYADEPIAEINLVYAESVSKNYLLYVFSLVRRLAHNLIFRILVVLAVAAVAVYIYLVLRSNAMKKRKKKQKLKIVNINEMNQERSSLKSKRYIPRH